MEYKNSLGSPQLRKSPYMGSSYCLNTWVNQIDCVKHTRTDPVKCDSNNKYWWSHSCLVLVSNQQRNPENRNIIHSFMFLFLYRTKVYSEWKMPYQKTRKSTKLRLRNRKSVSHEASETQISLTEVGILMKKLKEMNGKALLTSEAKRGFQHL